MAWVDAVATEPPVTLRIWKLEWDDEVAAVQVAVGDREAVEDGVDGPGDWYLSASTTASALVRAAVSNASWLSNFMLDGAVDDVAVAVGVAGGAVGDFVDGFESVLSTLMDRQRST